MSEHSTAQPGFKKALNAFDSYALGFGAMIGFGWVVLTGGWLEDAGTAGAAIAMGGGGLIMALVALLYAELTAAMPKAGGEHHYLMRGMGPRWAFIGSWGITGGYISIVAFEAVALPRTISYLFPQILDNPMYTVFGSEVAPVWVAIGVVAAIVITAINYFGVKLAGVVQTFVVVFLIIVGIMLVTGSFMSGEVSNMEPFFTGTTGLFTVLIVVPFLFVGFDVIPQASEELNMSPRRIGKLIPISVLIAGAWYVMVILTSSSSMPAGDLAASDLATADAMGALWNSQIMANVLLAGGIAGILTSWIALLIGASRLLYAMGRSSMLPAWFGKLHPKFNTPSNAVLFIGALSVAAPFFGTGMLGWLVDSGSPSIVVTYFMVCVVFLILRKKEPALERPFRVGRGKFSTTLGVLGMILTFGLFTLYIPGMPASIDTMSYVFCLAWWAIGMFFLFRIPKGIEAGVNTEALLLTAVRERKAKQKG
ncbi:MAG: APC family permease [Agrococcus casei]|uniref:APC family permease n=1 Tax=Agrococcus casei TaxID=343512 RepID=UPI003F9A952C